MTDHPGRTPGPAVSGPAATLPGVTPSDPRDAPPGLFVSFEGGDGVGKSTQVRLLRAWFEERGREVVATREPGGTPLGLELRAAVMHGGHVAPRAEALIYAADRAHHVATVIRPALARGAVVLTDRYLDSSVAYQGDGRGLGADDVERLSLWATEDLMPVLTVLLDLDPRVGLARLTDRGAEPDRLERAGLALHERTRAAFLARAAADPGRWLVLDAALPVEDLHRAVVERVTALLGDPGGDAR